MIKKFIEILLKIIEENKKLLPYLLILIPFIQLIILLKTSSNYEDNLLNEIEIYFWMYPYHAQIFGFLLSFSIPFFLWFPFRIKKTSSDFKTKTFFTYPFVIWRIIYFIALSIIIAYNFNLFIFLKNHPELFKHSYNGISPISENRLVLNNNCSMINPFSFLIDKSNVIKENKATSEIKLNLELVEPFSSLVAINNIDMLKVYPHPIFFSSANDIANHLKDAPDADEIRSFISNQLVKYKKGENIIKLGLDQNKKPNLYSLQASVENFQRLDNLRIDLFNNMDQLTSEQKQIYIKWVTKYLGQWCLKLRIQIKNTLKEPISVNSIIYEVSKFDYLQKIQGTIVQKNPYSIYSLKLKPQIKVQTFKINNIDGKKTTEINAGEIGSLEIIFIPDSLIHPNAKWEGMLKIATDVGEFNIKRLIIETFDTHYCYTCL